MADEQPDLSKFSTGLTGWHHLTTVLGIYIPRRLKTTRQARLGLRRLRTRS